MRHGGLKRDIPLRFATYAGHTGVAEALAAAVGELRGGYVDVALVGGIDSLVDERSLKWLRLTGRLKSESNPIGLEPGEAAVFLALERGRHAGRGRGPTLGQIESIATAEEEGSWILGQQPTGRALGGCIRAIAGDSQGLWLVTDHNGEAGRAVEFGNVLARVTNSTRPLAPALLPSVSFGDTGAASGGLAACLAQTALLRKYAPTTTAVVASMGDGSERSAFTVTRTQGR
jgi:3-oxoacyl-[acyl-carrier-protein] synthase I